MPFWKRKPEKMFVDERPTIPVGDEAKYDAPDPPEKLAEQMEELRSTPSPSAEAMRTQRIAEGREHPPVPPVEGVLPTESPHPAGVSGESEVIELGADKDDGEIKKAA